MLDKNSYIIFSFFSNLSKLINKFPFNEENAKNTHASIRKKYKFCDCAGQRASQTFRMRWSNIDIENR